MIKDGRLQSKSIRDFHFDQLGEEDERLLPADITGIRRNRSGNAFLNHMQLGAAGDRLQSDGDVHLTGKVGIVEAIGVTKAFVRDQFLINGGERMAVTGAEVGERHSVAATDSSVHMMNFAGEAIGRQPFHQGVGVGEGTIEAFGCRAQHTVEFDRMSGHDSGGQIE